MEIFFTVIVDMKAENGIFQTISLMPENGLVIHILISGKSKAGNLAA